MTITGTASSGDTLTAGTVTFTVAAGGATKLVFTNAPLTNVAGVTNAATITVQRQDANGNPTTLGGAITVNLTSSSGTAAFRNSGDTATVTSIGIAAGASSSVTVVRYRDNTAGTPTITGALGGLTSATQIETVTPASVSKMAFTTSPGSAVAGSIFGVQPVIRTQDQFNNNSTVGLGINRTVTLTLTTGTGSLQGTVTVDMGTSVGNGVAAFSDLRIDTAGAKVITATSAGTSPTLAPITASLTVSGGGATQLAFSTTPQTLKTTTASGTITVERRDLFGNPTTVGGTITVNLSTTSLTGAFRNTADSATITTIDILSGASSASFRYRDTTVGAPTITAAFDGLTPATQVENVVLNTAPPTPSLLIPVNNAGQSDTTPTFTWSTVTDAEGDAVTYEIQVDNNSDFSSPVVLSPTASGLSAATYTPTTTLTAGTTYFWRVRSSDGIASSAYTTSRTLFIVAPGNWQLFPLTTTVRQSQAFTWQLTATNTTSATSALYCIRIAIPSANFTGVSAVINSTSGHTGWVTSTSTTAGTTTLQINTPTSGQNLAQNESLVFTRLSDVDCRDRRDRLARAGPDYHGVRIVVHSQPDADRYGRRQHGPDRSRPHGSG